MFRVTGGTSFRRFCRNEFFCEEIRNATFARCVGHRVGSSSLADPEHIEILRRGPRVWNAWREENPSQIPNLDDATLSLGERQLGPINGGPINLRKVSMRRAFLRSATLTEADLEAADMSGADLGQARLDRANLASANLSGALLAYADFNGAVLAGANLCGSNLQHVQNLIQEQINGSVCDAATVLPAHLENPVSKLEVSKKSKGGGSLSSDQGQSTFFSKIV